MSTIYIATGPPKAGHNLLGHCLGLLGLHQLQGSDQLGSDTINNLLLQDLGISPLSPAPMPRGWHDTSAAQKAGSRITELLTYAESVDNNFFIADPLLCRTLPLWQQALSKSDLKPQYIFLIRHPFEVAMSLEAKDGIDKTRGHILWYSHTRAALRQLSSQLTESTTSSPNNNSQITACPVKQRGTSSRRGLTGDNSLITYDQLLADPVSTLQNCFSTDPINDSQITNNSPALLDFVNPSLKHHHASDLPEADKEYFKPYANLYNQLRAQHTSTSVAQDSTLPAKQSLFSLNETCPVKQRDTSSRRGLTGVNGQRKISEISEDSPAQLNTRSVGEAIQPGWTQNSSLFSLPDITDHLLLALGQVEPSQAAISSMGKISEISEDSWINFSSKKALTGDNRVPELTATLFQNNGEHIKSFDLISDQWQKLSFPIPDSTHIRNKQLTFQPLNTYGTVSIATISLVNRATGKEILGFQGDGFDQLEVQGTTVRLPDKDNLVLLVTGEEPLLRLSVGDVPDLPLEVVVWVKGSGDQSILNNILVNYDMKLSTYTKEMNQRLDDIQKELKQSHKKIHDVIKKQSLNTAKQIEAYLGLQHYLNTGELIGDLHGWPVSPDFALYLIELIETQNYDLIIEFGSGTSTVLMAKALRKKDARKEGGVSAQQVAFEHLPEFHEKTLEQLKQAEADNRVKLVLAPLETYVAPDGSEYSYYACQTILSEMANNLDSGFGKILAVVDGPPQSTGKNARYPAVPILLEYFSNTYFDILLDDYNRVDEGHIVEMWEHEIGNHGQDYKLTHKEFEKGACLINIFPKKNLTQLFEHNRKD